MSDELVGLIGRFIATHSIFDQELGFLLRDLQAPGTDARTFVKKGFREKVQLLDGHLDTQLLDTLQSLNDYRDLYAHGLFYGKQDRASGELEPWIEAFRKPWIGRPQRITPSELRRLLSECEASWQAVVTLKPFR